MRVIAVTKGNPPSGKEYMPDSYNGPGVYELADKRLVVVYKMPNSAHAACMVMQDGHFMPIQEIETGGTVNNVQSQVDIHKFMDQMIAFTGKVKE